MIRSFADAIACLEQRLPQTAYMHPGKPGLERMEYFMDVLDNPQRRYEVIHVGGTSGKGSTASYIASLLDSGSVGLYTSPHLEKITERIRVNGRDIEENEFVDVLNSMENAIEKVTQSRHGSPSYFEILTAMGFLFFYRKSVRIAVVEVGLGGLYDATNVVSAGVVIITTIGKDHTELLGNTLKDIANEKAGIIKKDCVVVSGVTQPSVRSIIRRACLEKNASCYFLGKDFRYTLQHMTQKGSVFDYEGNKRIPEITLKMVGIHQVENAAVAIAAAERYEERHRDVHKRIGSLANIQIPARFEILTRQPAVILDGAHNPDKMRASVATFQALFPGKHCWIIFAMKRDKDVRKVLRILAPICNRFIMTQFRLSGDMGLLLSYPLGDLVKIARDTLPSHDIQSIENAETALAAALQNAGGGDIILVTGSLYLVGEVRRSVKLTAGSW